MGEARRRALMGQGPQQQQIKINASELPRLTCDCGHDTFVLVYQLRLLGALVSPSGKDETINMQGFACTQCGQCYYKDTVNKLTPKKEETQEQKT